jgi:hypothetical protein
MIAVVAHAIMLKVRPFLCVPINSVLFASNTMKIKTKGRTAPFTTCDKMLIFTSGIFGKRMTAAPVAINPV